MRGQGVFIADPTGGLWRALGGVLFDGQRLGANEAEVRRERRVVRMNVDRTAEKAVAGSGTGAAFAKTREVLKPSLGSPTSVI